MKEDGSGLNQPVVAAQLPDGELLYSMQGYLGFVLIGTSKGVRVGVPGGNADLTIGALIPTDDQVQCFEGQDRFVWFGWSNFESTHFGLGRVDLSTFSNADALAPAYAADIMFAGTGSVTSVVTFQDRRIYTADVGSSVGKLYAEDVGVLEATGEIDSGLIDYGLVDEKLSLFIDMSHVSLSGGSHSLYLSVDRGAFGLLATMTEEHMPIATGEARGREFEVRVTISRSGSDTSIGPTMRSWTLRVQPAPAITEIMEVPLLIPPTDIRDDGYEMAGRTRTRNALISELCRTKRVALFTLGDDSWSVIVEDYDRLVWSTFSGEDAALGTNSTNNVLLKQVA
jgi:hypothetical protein